VFANTGESWDEPDRQRPERDRDRQDREPVEADERWEPHAEQPRAVSLQSALLPELERCKASRDGESGKGSEDEGHMCEEHEVVPGHASARVRSAGRK
jgi:hypothetical protein